VENIEIKNAIIESVSLTNDDHGCLSMWLHLDYGDGTHQGFGGYALYLPKSFTHHNILSTAGHFIFRCMEIADVVDYEKMKGKSIRVKSDKSIGMGFGGKIIAIGHIVKDDWFNPSEDFKTIVED